MPTQEQFSLQMLAQLRLLDPSISAEIGTPERKIIDTNASALYDNQIDLDALSAGLDVDSKYGAQLDRFFSIFGFNRQKATFATGYVTFSRTTPSNVDIRIPGSARVRASVTAPSNADFNTDVDFYTLYDTTLSAGETVSAPVPIRALTAGDLGNVAAAAITQIVGTTIYGVTAVTNAAPTSSGKDSETDEEFKVRFKNTLFRNLAGTQDQYMALAIATAFTSRANVVGPQSHYREYVQIPPVDDASSYDVNGDASVDSGGGSAGEFTTALSTIPYAKYIYANELPAYVSNGQVGIDTVFYRQDVDFALNSPGLNHGDALRFTNVGLDVAPASAPTRPNVTFKNVYTGNAADVQAVRPGDVVLLEYSYMSSASRNDFANHITNAVDVFIDGGNDTQASMVTVRPSTATAFVDDPTSKYHYENYRRAGVRGKRPIIGNSLMPLFWQPVVDAPDQIVVGTTTYLKGVHYWAVEDVSGLSGTNRARGGIEWSTKVNGKAQSDALGDPSSYTGKIITDATGDPVGGQPIKIDGYTYDQNIVDLQAALEGSRQITTDVLAHRARRRYFKLDVTIMYAPGASVADVNNQIRAALDTFLRSQYFGTAVQLSDLLSVIHNVSGVDNVRWTTDVPLITGVPSTSLAGRIIETIADGTPLLGVTADRIQPGTTTRPEIQGLYLVGQPTGGSFQLYWNGLTTADLSYAATAAQIQTALNALAGIGTVTVTEDQRSTTGVTYTIRSFRVTWTANGANPSIQSRPGTTPLSGGPFIMRNDFFLRDNELAQLAEGAYTPASGIPDTVPGLIIRPRAQNTWVRSQ